MLTAQTPYFFYNHEKERVYLSLNTKYAFLSVREQKLPANIQQHNVGFTELKSDRPERGQFQTRQETSRFFTTLSFEETLSDEQYLYLLSDIRTQNEGVIISPFFQIEEGDKIGLSNFFYVKLNELADTTLLRQMAERTNNIIIEQDMFMPLWFVMSITEKSELNALESANLFFESGLFQAAEPDLMVNVRLCVNDQFFSGQWGLRNTGQNGGRSGVDIRACQAWQLSRGDNITIAIIDEGIELDHPDLEENIHELIWDTQNRSSPSQVRGEHGIPVAGIAGAVQNNTIGISGVAPNSKLMSISRYLGGSQYQPLIRQDLAAGINWAWDDGGADVINNSWGHNALQGSYIVDAINNAVTQGRLRVDGTRLGTVVIFASGNDNSNVIFPASLPNVITVGAISLCGERKSPSSCDGESWWGSNFGTMLDVVAPGVLIYTTTNQEDYTAWFSGTSAAAPFVAGVAALVLSANPNLTQAQVRSIIESTAQKVNERSLTNPNGYVYFITSGRPHGTWNNKVGYGLVNAYEAVKTAMALCVHSFVNQPDVTTNRTITACDGSIEVGDVNITNSSTLTIDAPGGTIITGPVILGEGSGIILR